MTSTSFSYDVFLSHSSRDKSAVRELAEYLRQNGVRVWFDEWNIRPGDSIPNSIEDGLTQSRVLILAMSAAAFTSGRGNGWEILQENVSISPYNAS